MTQDNNKKDSKPVRSNFTRTASSDKGSVSRPHLGKNKDTKNKEGKKE